MAKEWKYNKERHKEVVRFYRGPYQYDDDNNTLGRKHYEANKELTKNVDMGRINRVGGVTSNWNFTAPRVEL